MQGCSTTWVITSWLLKQSDTASFLGLLFAPCGLPPEPSKVPEVTSYLATPANLDSSSAFLRCNNPSRQVAVRLFQGAVGTALSPTSPTGEYLPVSLFYYCKESLPVTTSVSARCHRADRQARSPRFCQSPGSGGPCEEKRRGPQGHCRVWTLLLLAGWSFAVDPAVDPAVDLPTDRSDQTS